MIKKITFAIVSLIILGLLVFIFGFFSSLKKPPTSTTRPLSSPIPSPIIPTTETIEISNIKVNNFYKSAERIDGAMNVYIVDEPDKYQILYEESFNQFLISILSSPFEELRNEAEQRLISDLEIQPQEACSLNVFITTPDFANPDFSGKAYGLSFCEQ